MDAPQKASPQRTASVREMIERFRTAKPTERSQRQAMRDSGSLPGAMWWQARDSQDSAAPPPPPPTTPPPPGRTAGRAREAAASQVPTAAAASPSQGPRTAAHKPAATAEAKR